MDKEIIGDDYPTYEQVVADYHKSAPAPLPYRELRGSKMLHLDDATKSKIIEEALAHIKTVEADPDIKMANVDPYDAWFSFNERIDFNVHESNFGSEYDDEPCEWHCAAYAVELDEDEYFRINTDKMSSLFTYQQGQAMFHNE